MHRILYHQSLSTFSSLLSSRSSRNRRKPFQIGLPTVRTTLHQHSFFFHTALLWNSLPHLLQAARPAHQFRTALEQLWHKHKYNPTSDLCHSELSTVHGDPPDHSASALEGNSYKQNKNNPAAMLESCDYNQAQDVGECEESTVHGQIRGKHGKNTSLDVG